MSSQIVPRRTSAQVARVGFRLKLEKLPGDRVQTELIDIAGAEFSLYAKYNRVDGGIEWLAGELARHLGIKREDVDVNEVMGADVRGGRRFRLIAHYLGKPESATDGCAAFMLWKSSGTCKQPRILPDFIDI